MEKAVIFDFDGTIADTFNESADVLYEISKNTKYRMSKYLIKRLMREKNLKENVKDLGISKIELILLTWKLRREFRKRISRIMPFESIKEVIHDLKKDHKLILLTSNSKSNVKQFLKKYDMDYFDAKYCGSSFFGKAKKMAKIIKKHGLHGRKVICIGDETRDIEACRQNGCINIAVTWGYNNKSLLEKEKPDYIVDKVEELAGVIKKV